MHHEAGRVGEQLGRGVGERGERGDEEQTPAEPQHQQEPPQDQGQGCGPRHGRHRPARPGKKQHPEPVLRLKGYHQSEKSRQSFPASNLSFSEPYLIERSESVNGVNFPSDSE